ncbi:MAG TPA: DUF4190 domain-containing protein [Tepidisphaeraceae bacterium]
MTQYPPPPAGPAGPSYAPPPPARTNGLALASLIISIVGFGVLFVGGLVGVILGTLSLRKSRDPNVGGHGMAVAGIVIGLLSILTSFIIVGGIYYGVHAAIKASEAPRLAARQFMQDLSGGDPAAASKQVTGGLTPADLNALAEKLHPLGAFKDMTSSQINMNNTNGVATCTLHGIAEFANGNQTYDIMLTRVGGVWKVSQAQFP